MCETSLTLPELTTTSVERCHGNLLNWLFSSLLAIASGMISSDGLIADMCLDANVYYNLMTVAPERQEAVERKSLRLPSLAQ